MVTIPIPTLPILQYVMYEQIHNDLWCSAPSKLMPRVINTVPLCWMRFSGITQQHCSSLQPEVTPIMLPVLVVSVTIFIKIRAPVSFFKKFYLANRWSTAERSTKIFSPCVQHHSLCVIIYADVLKNRYENNYVNSKIAIIKDNSNNL